MHIIAADVGGTKTRMAFVSANEPQRILFEQRYLSAQFPDFESMLQAFIKDSDLAGCEIALSTVAVLTLALPGLVSGSTARLTNLPWVIEKQKLKTAFNINKIDFMNDFQASAIGTEQLLEKDRVILNPGVLHSDQLQKNTTRVAVGAGTGLGVAWVQGNNANLSAHDTEGGHIDFAPVNETQIRLLQFLMLRFNHVSYERILSGDGLVALYEFCSGKQMHDISAEWVSKQSNVNPDADKALSLFVQIYAAYIGNIALLFKPYGGIFITGGIAAKIAIRMQSDEFIKAYLNKGRMDTLAKQIAVYLVTDERIGLLGAIAEASKTHQLSSQQTLLQQVSK